MISVTVASSSITYSVVGLPKNEGAEFGVQIDGSDIYRLTPSEEDSQILFRVDAPVAEESYRFVELNTDSDEVIDGEEFERDPIESEINQIYGRSWTTQSVETFTDIHKRIGVRKPSTLHSTDEIPALHIVADQEEVDRIHEHYNQNIKIEVDMTFIGAHDIKKFSKVQFHIAGKDTRFKSKPSYDFTFTNDDNLSGYKSLSLQASTNDPTFLRNKVAYEMALSTGSGVSYLSWKRVYLNGVSLGLYIFTENHDDSWMNENANPDLPDYKHGVFYKAVGSSYRNDFSDLKYISDEPEEYRKHGYEIGFDDAAEKKGYTTLASFINFIDEQLKKPASNSTENEKEVIAEWGPYIDSTIFLRGVALEFLTSAYDNYLAWGRNYGLYRCPILKTFIYLYDDMESTFGLSPLPESEVLEGDYRHIEGFSKRPLTRALLRIPHFRKYYEEALKHIAMSIFNPKISFPIIDSWTEFLREDVEWDRTLTRINADKDFSNPPEPVSNGGKVIKNTLPRNFPKNTDVGIYKELKHLDQQNIDFQDAIDGPTGVDSLFGLKEFIQRKYDNVRKHL